MTQYFEYGNEETEWLKAKDHVLSVLIDEIGHIQRPVISDLFTALVNSIVGQQISSKAMATVWSRMQDRHGPITPERICETSAEDLQKCGMTMRKAEYIKEIAESVLSGNLDLAQLHDMSDDDVCKKLSQLRGIGTWTAEMLMIFSMQRPNIFSKDDLAILRGLRMVYRHKKITPALFAKYRRRYSPYATVASLYLWAVAGGSCPSLTDPAVKIDTKKKAAKK
jgi:3-methyladenine DNA glycosylase/8-oxoguanine DNA glycosylase